MSLRTAVAVPFRTAGTDRLGEGEFVVALSLDRDWFTPDQAKRVADTAAARGLVRREDGELVAAFDPGGVQVPEGFAPDESVLREESVFETVLDALVTAGLEKRDAVAAVNRRQERLDITLEAAAILQARAEGIDVPDAAGRARAELAAETSNELGE